MSLVKTLLNLMMFLVLFLVRKCEEKEQVSHQVMRLPCRVGEDKRREEGSRVVEASLEREDPNTVWER